MPDPQPPPQSDPQSDPERDQHKQVRDDVIAMLRADPSVQALAGDRVSADAGGDLPRVRVEAGRAWPRPGGGGAPMLAQRDLKVTCAAADENVLGLLITAVHRRLNGEEAPGVSGGRLVLTDTPRVNDEGGGTFSRRDTFGCFVRPPARRSGGGRLSPAAPAPADDRMARENEELRRRIAELEGGAAPPPAAPPVPDPARRPKRGD